MSALPDRIDALLPQTQCARCGFDGCRPYAEAIAAGTAAINRCPPGGAAGIAALAALLGRAPMPLDPACGAERPPQIARIDPAVCIGCAKCIAACPVDAIIGARKRMHTVASALCTGCELCVPACPVDCIEMRADAARGAWTAHDASAARQRHERRRTRLAGERAAQDERLARDATAPAPGDDATQRKRATIEAAVRRARQRLAEAGGAPSERTGRPR